MSESAREEAENRDIRMLSSLGLTLDREELYSRIERRVDEQIERGLSGRFVTFSKRVYASDAPSMQGLGYKEIVPLTSGAIAPWRTR